MVVYGKSSQEYPHNAERGNSMPKLHPAFGHCLQRFIFFQKIVLSKAVYICHEHGGYLNKRCVFIVLYGKQVPFYISTRHCQP